MSSITSQQAKLDLEFVPKGERLEIGKCNIRLNPGKIQREPTFQVILDALALTPCYSAFLITADVPEVYMHQFWDSVYKHDTICRFKIDKKKRFKLTLEIFRDIFKICARVQGQDFDALPVDEDIVSFLRELRHTGKINSLIDVIVDHIHQPWRTFVALINKSLSGKTMGLDKLRLSRAQILWSMYHQKNVDYVELLWEDFIYQIDNKAYKKQEKMYYPRFTEVIIHYFLTQDKIISWRNKIGMHTSRDDYLINTLRFVSVKEATQIYGAILLESLTSLAMKETTAYKTYLVSPEEPTKNSKRVERPTKKSSKAPAGGVVIRENHEMPLSKKKEKMTVEKYKGIDLLSKVELTKEAQFKEVRKKCLRDFHKTYLSGSGTITKTAPSVAKIKPSVTHKGTGVKLGVLNVTEEESSEMKKRSNSKHGTDENESNSKSDKEDNEEEIGDDKEKRKTSLLEPHLTILMMKQRFLIKLKEGTNAELTNIQQGNENPKISQVIEDAHVTLFTVPQKTKVLVTSSSHSSDLASKFLNSQISPYRCRNCFSNGCLQSIPSFTPPPSQSTPTPPPTTKATNPPSILLDFTSVFQFNNRVTTLEIEVAELKKDDPLKTQVTALVDEHLDARIRATRYESINFLSASITARITKQTIQSEELEFEVADSDMPKDQEENPGNDDEEPKGKVASKRDWFTKPKRPQEPTDPNWNDRKTPQQGPTQSWLMTLALSKKPNWENLEGGDYPFDLTKPLTLFMNRNRQMVLVDYFFNNDLKYLQGGISTMTYTTSLTKTKATQYDLPGIEDMVPNFWSPVKVAYDKHALWGICYWRDQRNSFYGYARGLDSTHDVYFTKCILAVTRVEVMRKHGCGYLKEIVVRRANNDIYKFKEVDFLRLHINNIKDKLLLVVQHRLSNLSGDDVSDFAIALRMFTRSLVIQKRVEDLYLGVASYQKKINITKPETTRLGIRKKDPYTPYQDPQGFIYVNTLGRNRLMCSNDLYKFSDGTLTRLQTLLEDILRISIWSTCQNEDGVH
nr:hypothetical protein [Tanacetum cinerariifolium]